MEERKLSRIMIDEAQWERYGEEKRMVFWISEGKGFWGEAGKSSSKKMGS